MTRRTTTGSFIFLTAIVVGYLLIFSDTVSSRRSRNRSKKTDKNNNSNNQNNVCKSVACQKSASLLNSCMNKMADPCEDFYEYTCGNFLNSKPFSGKFEVRDWFTEIQAAVMREIKGYLNLNNSPDDPEAVKKARSLYQMCMDTESLAKYGLDALKNYLTRVGLTPESFRRFNSNVAWYAMTANLKKFLNIDFLLEVNVQKDPLDPSIKRITLSRPNKTDPSKQSLNDYNEATENNKSQDKQKQQNNSQSKTNSTAKKKVGYKQYVDNVMSAIGYDQVSMYRISRIHDFIINRNKILTQAKDENYLLITVKGLQEKMADIKLKNGKPVIDWLEFLNLLFNGYVQESEIIYVADINYIVQIMTMLSNVDMATIRYAMFWDVITKLLPNSRQDLNNLWNRYLSAVSDKRIETNRTMYCLTMVMDNMGTALAYKYARNRNVILQRKQVRFMAQNIYESFKQSFKDNTWIDPQTKESIKKKLFNVTTFVGFPVWLTKTSLLDNYYSDVIVIEHEFMKSIIENQNLSVRKNFQKYNRKATDKAWKKQKYLMNPVNVRAFYNPKINAVNIPVAIMRFPFYNHGLQTLNYGALGTLLAHEISHGFDSTGMKFDDDDNVKNLWTEITELEFNNKAKCFVEYYDNLYVKQAGSTVNGALTLAENIADNVGFKHALLGYRKYVARRGKPEPLLPGFEGYSHEKLFTIAYGVSLCKNYNKQLLKEEMKSRHALQVVRVKGVTSNSEEFEDIWGCKKKPRTDKCSVW